MNAHPLRERAVGNLDGSGNLTLKVGPLSAMEKWRPGNVHVSANANPTNQALCRVFVGPDTTQSNFRDETPLGSTGDSTGACNADELKVGDKIWAVWTGGDPGVQAVLAVTGVRYV